jgi:hypothetical protein
MNLGNGMKVIGHQTIGVDRHAIFSAVPADLITNLRGERVVTKRSDPTMGANGYVPNRPRLRIDLEREPYLLMALVRLHIRAKCSAGPLWPAIGNQSAQVARRTRIQF